MSSDKPSANSASTEKVLSQVYGKNEQPKGSPEAFPAATVVVIREAANTGELEVLMLRKNSRLQFAGGQWVFPGGRVDADELEGNDLDRAYQLAAIRETKEEANIDLASNTLYRFARWVTPVTAKKRFDTWFYVTLLSSEQDTPVAVDGSEIQEHRWMSPSAVLKARDSKELEIMPPTYLTLLEIKDFTQYAELIDFYEQREFPDIMPKTHHIDGKMLLLYPGDAGYEVNDTTITDEPQHRFLMGPDKWQYIKTL